MYTSYRNLMSQPHVSQPTIRPGHTYGRGNQHVSLTHHAFICRPCPFVSTASNHGGAAVSFIQYSQHKVTSQRHFHMCAILGSPRFTCNHAMKTRCSSLPPRIRICRYQNHTTTSERADFCSRREAGKLAPVLVGYFSTREVTSFWSLTFGRRLPGHAPPCGSVLRGCGLAVLH